MYCNKNTCRENKNTMHGTLLVCLPIHGLTLHPTGLARTPHTALIHARTHTRAYIKRRLGGWWAASTVHFLSFQPYSKNNARVFFEKRSLESVFLIALASGKPIKLSPRCSTVEAKIIAEVHFDHPVPRSLHFHFHRSYLFCSKM